MESYGFSVSFLFIISTSICYSVIDIESPNQEAVTLLQAGSLLKLFIAKLVYSWIFMLPLVIFAVIYPALFNKFDRVPSMMELFMSFVYHISSAWLGVAIACWFTAKLIHSRLLSFLMLCLVIAITLGVLGIEKLLPVGVDKILVIVPPLQKSIYVLSHYDEVSTTMNMMAIGSAWLYGFIVIAIFLIIMNKRKLD